MLTHTHIHLRIAWMHVHVAPIHIRYKRIVSLETMLSVPIRLPAKGKRKSKKKQQLFPTCHSTRPILKCSYKDVYSLRTHTYKQCLYVYMYACWNLSQTHTHTCTHDELLKKKKNKKFIVHFWPKVFFNLQKHKVSTHFEKQKQKKQKHKQKQQQRNAV